MDKAHKAVSGYVLQAVLISGVVRGNRRSVVTRGTMAKLVVFCIGAVAMIMFPPTVETWVAVSPDIPQRVVRSYDFIGMIEFGRGLGPEGYSAEVNWPRLALQIGALAFVVAIAGRPNPRLAAKIFPSL